MFAAAVARSFDVRKAFPDGVVWLSIGRYDPELTVSRCRALLEPFCYATQRSAQIESVEAFGGALRRGLESRRVLLILDDVRHVAGLQWLFNALGPACSVLVTTQDAGVATALADVERCIDLGEPSLEASVELLQSVSGRRDVPGIMEGIAQETGKLPLALAMCGAMIRQGYGPGVVLDMLRSGDTRAIGAEIANFEHGRLAAALAACIDSLAMEDPHAAACYRALSAFRLEGPVPESAVFLLWSTDGGLDATRGLQMLVRMASRCLLRLCTATRSDGAIVPAIQLHALQADYLSADAVARADLTKRLLTAYSRLSQGDWHGGPNDGYYFENLIFHLLKSAEVTAAQQLLVDYDWLIAKLKHTGVSGLLGDFALAPNEEPVKSLRDHLRRAAGRLSDAESLTVELSRLDTTRFQSLTQLSLMARQQLRPSFLRPLPEQSTNTLAPLVATFLTAPGVMAIALAPNGVICAWTDAEGVTIASCETGQCLQAIAVGSRVSALAFSSDSRWIAVASAEGLMVWSVDKWTLAYSIEVRTNRVDAIAFQGGTRDVEFVSGGSAFIVGEAAPKPRRISRWKSGTRTAISLSGDLICEVDAPSEWVGGELSLRTWADGRKTWSIDGLTGSESPSAVALSPIKQTLFTARLDGETCVRRRDLDMPDDLTDVFAVGGRSFDLLAVDATGLRFLTFGNGGLELWDAGEYRAHQPLPTAAAIAATGDRIVQVVGDSLRVSASDRSALLTVPHGMNRIKRVAIDVTGSAVAACESGGRRARIVTWRLHDGTLAGDQVVEDCDVFIAAMALQRDAECLFVSSYG
mgnify:CR=1 FL=1